jgi:hypothetical protein
MDGQPWDCFAQFDPAWLEQYGLECIESSDQQIGRGDDAVVIDPLWSKLDRGFDSEFQDGDTGKYDQSAALNCNLEDIRTEVLRLLAE